MKCIFCKKDSSSSVSVEHITPESLGNSKSILPKGAVCDSCNNYFASKVEKPVLESEEFNRLRFNQLVRNKKGKPPKTTIIVGDKAVVARRDDTTAFSFETDDFEKIDNYLKSTKNQVLKMYIPITGKPPSNHHMSRFLAKMALEAFAYRVIKIEGWNEYIVEHEQLDPIRIFARFPKKGEEWVFSKRRIYPESDTRSPEKGQTYQVINEWDILVTGGIEDSEFYFVIAIFGMEYAINLAGSSVEGYNKWLKNNSSISPLHHVKNSELI